MKDNISEESKFWTTAGKVLSDDASKEEQDQLTSMLDQNPALKETFDSMKSDNKSISTYLDGKTIDVEKAWTKQFDAIQQYETKSNVWPKLISVAAILSLFLLVGYMLFQQNETVYETAENQQTIVLPDGSKVSLNRNSHISIDHNFGQSERRLSLDGEAFFEVTKNPNKPFIVETHKDYIKVLGTSFNVKATSETEVFVKEGKVLFATRDASSQQLLLREQYAKNEDGTIMLQKTEKTSNPILWKTKDLDFDNAPLAEVMSKLKAVYNVSFEYTEETIHCKHTGRYKDVPLSVVLESLKTIYSIDISKKKEKTHVNFIACH